MAQAPSRTAPESIVPAFSPQTWLWRLVALLLIAASLWGLQTLTSATLNDYIIQIIILAGINIILAVSLTLINGVTGQFSLGHAGFMAVGAYASAAFTYYAGPRLALPGWTIFLLAIAIAAVMAGIAGLIVGLPSLRLRGDYLAIVTLGFGQIIIVLITTIKEVGGARGFIDLPPYTNFVWVYAMVFACILSVRNLADSQLGRAMRAVRDDEVAAEAAGINTTRIKVLAFVISSMWAGVAGALQAHYIQSAHPGSFTFLKSVEVVVMVVLGGLGSITGATVTAVLLKVLEEVLRSLTGAFWVCLGLVVLAAILSLPRYRDAMRRGATGWLLWLRWPVFSAVILLLLWYGGIPWAVGKYGQDWVNTLSASLRYIIYALILIVLMLLRPQGLLGREELSWALFRRKKGAEPVDEGVAGTLK
jgi:branched-chain amino acid transport system permease protein